VIAEILSSLLVESWIEVCSSKRGRADLICISLLDVGECLESVRISPYPTRPFPDLVIPNSNSSPLSNNALDNNCSFSHSEIAIAEHNADRYEYNETEIKAVAIVTPRTSALRIFVTSPLRDGSM